MYKSVIAGAFSLLSISTAGMLLAEEAGGWCAPGKIDPTACLDTKIGDVCTIRFSIATARIGSRDADRGDNPIYTAPRGFQILSTQVYSDRELHSGVSTVKIFQSEQITFRNESLAKLVQDTSKDILSGKLSYKGKSGSAFGQAEFEDFQKEILARVVFLTDTNSSVEFRWFVDSKTGDHGAAITACADVTLMRYPTGDELAAVSAALKFAGETGIVQDTMEIIDRVSQIKPD